MNFASIFFSVLLVIIVTIIIVVTWCFYYHRNVVGEIHTGHNIKMENMFVNEFIKDTYQWQK